MNKRTILLPVLALVLIMTSCGPAAEDKATMISRSKVFQDSIANMIKTSTQEAEMPNAVAPAMPDTAKK